jgi:hypothetical protein
LVSVVLMVALTDPSSGIVATRLNSRAGSDQMASRRVAILLCGHHLSKVRSWWTVTVVVMKVERDVVERKRNRIKAVLGCTRFVMK